MGERMTSGEARREAEKLGGDSTLPGMRWGAAADALLAWEEEAEARAGMPALLAPWAVIGSGGEIWRRHDSKQAAVAEAKGIGNARAVRLAVVEVAEPEPPRPVREQGPSGWWYTRRDGEDGVSQYPSHESDHDSSLIGYFHLSTNTRIPPADRALVARLLGEVG